MKILVVSEKTGFESNVKLALGILSSVLENYVSELYVFDNDGDYEFSPSEILDSCPFVPDSIFLSITTLNALRSYEFVKEAKKRWPQVIAVGGGIHMKINFEEALKNGLDIIVRHEVEPVIGELMSVLERRNAPYLIQFPPFAAVENFALPNWKYLEKKNYKDLGSVLNLVVSSRGCPFRCNFCADEWTTKIRVSSPDYLIKHIKIALQYSHDIKIMDNNFCLERKRVEQFCKLISKIKNEDNLTFMIQTHIMSALDDELASQLKQAGITSISLGIERLTPESLKLINKSGSLERTLNKLDIWLRHGIKVGVNFLLGFPFETAELIRRELEAFIRLRDNGAIVTPFMLIPIPGTPYYDTYPECHGWYRNESFLKDYRDFKNTTFFKYFDKGAIGLGWLFFWRNIYNFDSATSASIVEAAQEFGDLRRLPIRRTFQTSDSQLLKR